MIIWFLNRSSRGLKKIGTFHKVNMILVNKKRYKICYGGVIYSKPQFPVQGPNRESDLRRRDSGQVPRESVDIQQSF